MHPDLLIIFLKNPVKGKVKTRLAKSIGDEAALKLYHKMVSHTLGEADAVEATILLYYSDIIPSEYPWSYKPKNPMMSLLQDQSPDLGKRMAESIKSGLKEHDHVIVIGSDCPDITAELIQRSFSLLRTNDIVLGPANDGGFYLLGLSNWSDSIFDEVHWSTETVLEKCIKNIEGLGLSYILLEKLTDVDTLEDLQQINRQL